MTILNVKIINTAVALVGCDTAGGARNGTLFGNVSKMFFLPAVGCVLTGRGDSGFISLLYDRLNGKGEYDDLAEALPDIAKNLFRWCFFYKSRVQEILLVGYSLKLARMACTSVILTKRPLTVVVEDRLDYAAPWVDRFASMPAADTPAAMLSLAQAQLRLFREEAPQGAAGGRFVIAELSGSGMRIWRAGALR